MRFHFKSIIHILGMLLIINSVFMLTALPFSIYFQDMQHWAILKAFAITMGAGSLAFFFTRQTERVVKKRDVYIVVTFGWILMALSATLPYLFSGAIHNLTDAFFECISGYTTTGASILKDIEAVAPSILYWRSLTQWIGGMGIIVLTVAILPLIGVGGMQLFVAEAPGISADKLRPRITDTAKRLWVIYIGLTLTETVLLRVFGMTWYDAFNHSLTTMATGGFSTKNASIAHFPNPLIQYTIIIFMFFAGTNFSMMYFGFQGQLKKVWNNDEFRAYFLSIVGLSTVFGLYVGYQLYGDIELGFRDVAFQLVSLITTTGFVSADYTSWAPFLTILCFILLFVGGSAGSTAGGIKTVRHLILAKNGWLDLKRQLHPSAVIPVRLNGKAVSGEITYTVLAFVIIFLITFVIGAMLLAMTGLDLMTAMGASATSLGNVGPGIGSVGPVDNFAWLPPMAKWICSSLMLLGRLELFTVLLLFTPFFWRGN
ncbi:TrkH family potassium uptake protein [Persicobacter psychrovividus]|uniref:Trk system potassium transporter TrkH n=1 Tax=Persicobacter psychrovividus TaxID=387638 RepID=A0ABN6LAW1_9BACT|nr:Trk system potassium transporter TrkH [Persicobacter psychrovividus]